MSDVMRLMRWLPAAARGSRSLKAAAISGVGKLLSLGVAVLLAPLMIHSIGVAGYGCFATLVGLAAFMDIADLGVGNGLISRVAGATADGPDATPMIRRAVLVSLAMGTAGVAIVVATSLTVQWAWLLSQPVQLQHAADSAACVAGIVLFCNVPAGIGAKLLSGLGRTPTVAGGSLAAAGLQLGLIGLAAEIHATLVAFTAAFFAPQLVVSLALAFVAARSLSLSPGGLLRDRRRPDASGDNWSFLALAVLGLLAYGTDTLVLAQLLGERAVATYSLGFRIFTLAPVFVALGLQVLWPAYAAARARGDLRWVKRTFRLTLAGAIGINTLWALAMLVAAPALLRVWIGDGASSPFLLRLALGAYVVVNGFTGPLAVLMNGFGDMRFQLTTAAIMTVVNVGLSLGLTRSIGVSGPIWGTVVAQVVCIVVPSLMRVRAMLHHSLRVAPDPARPTTLDAMLTG